MLEAFPEAKVVFHQEEEQFINGSRQYSEQEGDHFGFSLARNILPTQAAARLPNSKVIKLHNSTGDLALHVKWMSADVLQYHHVPGHSPGMVAFYHTPTKAMIAADAFMHVSNLFPLSETYKVEPGMPLRPFTPKIQQAKDSIKKLAAVAEAETYFASHDCLAGVSASSCRRYAAVL